VPMLGLCDGMKGVSLVAGIACLVALAGCRPNQVAQPTSPARSPSASPSPSPSPSPQPPQRLEAALPAPIEETGAATAAGSIYVMGGSNAAGQRPASAYVFAVTT